MHKSLIIAPTVLFLGTCAFAQVSSTNDTCATAFTPALSDGLHTVDTTGATPSGTSTVGLPPWVNNDTPDTQCQDYNGMPENLQLDVFFEFAPLMNSAYQFETCNMAGYDTKIAIYSGTCNNLTPLSCNDDGTGCAAFSSRLIATGLSNSSTYTVQVGGFGPTDQGTSSLNIATWTPPVPSGNDDCAGAVPLMTGLNIGAVDTTMATVSGVPAGPLPPFIDGATPDTGCEDFNGNGAAFFENLNSDVWFTYTPTVNGNFLFSTCNLQSYDTKLAIFSGTCGNETALACNDDGVAPCMNFSSELRVTGLTTGTTYLVAVGGFNAVEVGTSDLEVAQELPPGIGTPFCQTSPNSVGSGAVISAGGSTSVAANDLELRAGPMETGQPGIFYYGPDQIQAAFGDGFRCIGGAAGTIKRLFPFAIGDANGDMVFVVNNQAPAHSPQLQPGMTWNFQSWYRDPSAMGFGFNLSDGIEITFVP